MVRSRWSAEISVASRQLLDGIPLLRHTRLGVARINVVDPVVVRMTTGTALRVGANHGLGAQNVVRSLVTCCPWGIRLRGVGWMGTRVLLSRDVTNHTMVPLSLVVMARQARGPRHRARCLGIQTAARTILLADYRSFGIRSTMTGHHARLGAMRRQIRGRVDLQMVDN